MSRLIDADALMEASKYEFWQDCSAITPIGEYILGKFRQLIRNMPTVTPEPKWILCSERLPAVEYDILGNCSSKTVLLWHIERGYDVGYFNPVGVFETLDSDFCPVYVGKPGKDVIAWMPLPEPYREGET